MKPNTGGRGTKKGGRVVRKPAMYLTSGIRHELSQLRLQFEHTPGQRIALSRLETDERMPQFKSLLGRRYLQGISPSQRAEVLAFVHNFINTPRSNESGLYRLPTITELQRVFPYLSKKK